MGDIRNKLAKIEGLRREKEALARLNWIYANAVPKKQRASVRAPAPQKCACGYGPYQADLIAVDMPGWPKEQRLYCAVCVPQEHREDFQRALDLNMLSRSTT